MQIHFVLAYGLALTGVIGAAGMAIACLEDGRDAGWSKPKKVTVAITAVTLGGILMPFIIVFGLLEDAIRDIVARCNRLKAPDMPYANVVWQTVSSWPALIAAALLALPRIATDWLLARIETRVEDVTDDSPQEPVGPPYRGHSPTAALQQKIVTVRTGEMSDDRRFDIASRFALVVSLLWLTVSWFLMHHSASPSVWFDHITSSIGPSDGIALPFALPRLVDLPLAAVWTALLVYLATSQNIKAWAKTNTIYDQHAVAAPVLGIIGGLLVGGSLVLSGPSAAFLLLLFGAGVMLASFSDFIKDNIPLMPAFGLISLNIAAFICTAGLILGFVHTLPLQLAGIVAMALAPRLFRS